jgi:DNA-binding response OmpR family regulator
MDDKQANPFEGSLDAQVHQLKSKLERGRRLIRIVQGGGYLFEAEDEHGASDYQLA